MFYLRGEFFLFSYLYIYKRYLHGGKTTMLYLNLSGHQMFVKRGLAPHRKDTA